MADSRNELRRMATVLWDEARQAEDPYAVITAALERVRAETVEDCAKIGEKFEIKDEVSGAIRRLASGEGEKP